MVMARYRDRQVDGTVIDGDWHGIKLGLVGARQDGQLADPSYVAARKTAASFAPRLGTEAVRRGALDIVGWRGVATNGSGQEGCCVTSWSSAMEPSGSGSMWPPPLAASSSKSGIGSIVASIYGLSATRLPIHRARPRQW